MVAHRVHCPKTAFESHDCNGHEGVPSRGMTDFDRTHPKFYSIRTQILLISRGEIMSKIYKIVNDINDKIYIGKTNSTIESETETDTWRFVDFELSTLNSTLVAKVFQKNKWQRENPRKSKNSYN